MSLNYLYKITSPSGRYYIGVTNNTSRRWAEHRRRSSSNNNSSIHKAICKYGHENMKYEILYQHQCRELIYHLESEYVTSELIASNVVYNLIEGGNDALKESLIHKAKVKALREIDKNGDTPAKRGARTWDRTNENNPNARPVKVREESYTSIKQACKSLNISKPTLYKLLRSDYTLKGEEGFIPFNSRPVYQIDITTHEILEIYPNASCAMRELERKNSANLHRACKGFKAKKTCWDYHWAYADEYDVT